MPTSGASPSPSSSTSNTSAATIAIMPSNARNPNDGSNAMQSWWESISKARSRILSLASLLSSPHDLSTLADSDRPARSLLDSPAAYAAVSAALSASPSSGTGDDPLCNWLYDTFQCTDPDLQLVAISFVPLLAGIYLSRLVSSSSSSDLLPSLAGFEAVLLAVYSAETKARAGKPLLVAVPDLSLPSLYHSPSLRQTTAATTAGRATGAAVGVLSPPLEPQIAIKSTKRACIVGVALDSYCKNISVMPTQSKIDFCEFVASWAGQDCPCRFELDGDNESNIDEGGGGITNEMAKLGVRQDGNADGTTSHCNGQEDEGDWDRDAGVMVVVSRRRGTRICLPWELLQPILRILGHCLLAPLNSQEVKDAASEAVRCVYARASHDLLPQVILATRSLIQLDKSSRKAMRSELLHQVSTSNPNTPSKPKKPEVYLVSK